MRTKLLITGAAGGMGRASARLLGLSHDLVLTDINATALDGFAAELETDGYTIRGTHAGDLADGAMLNAIVADLADGAPFAVVHTAGISPAMGTWRQIIETNLVGTEKLLRAIDPHLVPGSVAVLIASVAAYAPLPTEDAAAMLAAPMDEHFAAWIERVIVESADPTGSNASIMAYILSKKGVQVIAEKRSLAWGLKGARIISISPGMILTPMGRQEIEATPGARVLGEQAPAGRLGSALDIAKAVRFLVSDAASFITGCDLRVDGGSVGSRR